MTFPSEIFAVAAGKAAVTAYKNRPKKWAPTTGLKVFPEIQKGVGQGALLSIRVTGIPPHLRRGVMKAAGIAYLSAIKRAWPVDTGRSKRGLYFRIGGQGGRGLTGDGNTIYIKNKEDYAKYVVRYMDPPLMSVIRATGVDKFYKGYAGVRKAYKKADQIRADIHRRLDAAAYALTGDVKGFYHTFEGARPIRQFIGRAERKIEKGLQFAEAAFFADYQEFGNLLYERAKFMAPVRKRINQAFFELDRIGRYIELGEAAASGRFFDEEVLPFKGDIDSMLASLKFKYPLLDRELASRSTFLSSTNKQVRALIGEYKQVQTEIAFAKSLGHVYKSIVDSVPDSFIGDVLNIHFPRVQRARGGVEPDFGAGLHKGLNRLFEAGGDISRKGTASYEATIEILKRVYNMTEEEAENFLEQLREQRLQQKWHRRVVSDRNYAAWYYAQQEWDE